MKGLKGLLFLNGTPPSVELMAGAVAKARLLKSQNGGRSVFCTDGAYGYLKNYTEPDVLLGDFDSLDLTREKIPNSVEVITYGAEKDFTDGFLAAKIMIERGFSEVDIYGAFGGRPDHEMSNYLILALFNECGVRARFVGERFDVFIIGGARKAAEPILTAVGKIVSLVPFSDETHILYTKGLKYPISDLVMSKTRGLSGGDYIMGVSNVAVADRVEYAITSGLALVYVER